MVRGVDDERIFGETGGIQRSQHTTDAVIHETDQTVIGGDGQPHLFFIKIALIIKEIGHGHDLFMVGDAVGGQRQRCRIIEVEKCLRCFQRIVRADKGDEARKGFCFLSGAASQSTAASVMARSYSL